MDKVIKKIQHTLVAISFALVSTSLMASKLSKEEVDARDFQLHGLALFGGTDMFSSAIKIMTDSPFSHVGMLVYDAAGDVNDEASWYCFESTGSAGEVLKGVFPHVRITPWADVVANYGGSVTTRLMGFDDGKEPDAGAVTAFIRKYNGEKYETDIPELFMSLVDGNGESDTDALFCSELTAEMFMDLGYMERGASNNWLPVEFSEVKDEGLNLIGAFLGEEVTVKARRSKRIVRFGRWVRKVFRKLNCRGGASTAAA